MNLSPQQADELAEALVAGNPLPDLAHSRGISLAALALLVQTGPVQERVDALRALYRLADQLQLEALQRTALTRLAELCDSAPSPAQKRLAATAILRLPPMSINAKAEKPARSAKPPVHDSANTNQPAPCVMSAAPDPSGASDPPADAHRRRAPNPKMAAPTAPPPGSAA